MSNIVPFPTPATAEEVLDIAKKSGFRDSIIIGWDKNDDMVVIGSDMTEADMLYLLALAQREILE